MNILITIIVILVLWSVWGAFSSRVEQAKYVVLKKTKDFEIRNYPAHIVAQTTVSGTYRESLNQGFRIVAGYIFGNNKRKESIAMTAPVIAQQNKASNQKIAMTAPVIAQSKGTKNVISFGMPSSYSLKNLPTPNDPRVKLVTIPAMKMAVIRFGWSRSYSRVANMKAKLLAELKAAKIKVIGEPAYAGYNAPWTPPWMQRHEVMIQIK